MARIIDETLTANITPQEYETGVEQIIREWGVNLAEFKVQRLEKLIGSDGEYVIDVSARFETLGVSFLVLIECKHYKNPVKREVVQILHDKLRSTGAHKGIIFSTTSFQAGAIKYAQKHKIALIQFADTRTTIFVKGDESISELPDGAVPYIGWLVEWNKTHEVYTSLIDERHDLVIRMFQKKS